MPTLTARRYGHLAIVLLMVLSGAEGTRKVGDDDPGLPLFLTPYIEAGQLDEARNLSLTGPITGFNGEISYSGFFTVNPIYDSNMFFWFFLAKNNPETAPVICWLEGGPGESDFYTIFNEIGPYYVDEQLNLYPNNYTWIQDFNVLFFDSPIGTGYSFANTTDGYATNEDDVSRDVNNALRQFFTLFPEYVDHDLYLAGESYAGKYLPAVGYAIHMSNPTAEVKLNLAGIALGDGFVDPGTQCDYGDYLYNIGLIDSNQRAVFYQYQDWVKGNISFGLLDEAYVAYNLMILGAPPTLFTTYTGLNQFYNFLRTNDPPTYESPFVEQPDVRRSLHVGNSTLHDPSLVLKLMAHDMMNTTLPFLEFLLDNNYQVMLYSGQVDVIVAYFLTMNMLDTMTWNTVDDYRAAPRQIWKVDPLDAEVAGYARPSHNFVDVLIRDAGHDAPYDQSRFSQDMIARFINGKPWTA